MRKIRIETIQEFQERGGQITKLKSALRVRVAAPAKIEREIALKRLARWKVQQ